MTIALALLPPPDAPRIVTSAKRARLYRLAPLAERFWTKVDRSPGQGPKGECWTFTGSHDDRGYGQIREAGRGSRLLKAHRVSYVLHHGPLLDEQSVLHGCDYPPCVRPEHLSAGTSAQNSQEAAARGRLVYQVYPERCPRGERAPGARLTADQVEQIRRLRVDGWTQTRLAAEFGVTQQTISLLLRGETWSARRLVVTERGQVRASEELFG